MRPARGRGGGAGRATRATGRGTPDDPDQTQGFPQLNPRNQRPATPAAPQPWQYAIPTDEQMRTPLNIIPPDQRPRVVLRFADQNQLLVSGLLQGGADIAQRPVVVDVPVEKGHVVLFGEQPHLAGQHHRHVCDRLERHHELRQSERRPQAGREISDEERGLPL